MKKIKQSKGICKEADPLLNSVINIDKVLPGKEKFVSLIQNLLVLKGNALIIFLKITRNKKWPAQVQENLDQLT